MPKVIFEPFLQALKQDIADRFQIGDRYLSVRDIASRFKVSLQTAQKGVRELCENGTLSAKQKSGIFVLQKPKPSEEETRKTLVVLSRNINSQFYKPFLEGIHTRIGTHLVDVKVIAQDFGDVGSLRFGEYIVGLGADGIITLNFFQESALPFYYVLHNHIPIVSDIIFDTLPILPAVQTDNYKHAFKAGLAMLQEGFEEFFLFGFYPKENKRYLGFRDAVKNKCRSIQYIRINEFESLSTAISILSNMTGHTGIFLCDYSAVHYIASLCSRYAITFIERSIQAYDWEDEAIKYPNVQPIPCAAPSFKDIGYHLCDTLMVKWDTGAYPEPLQRKV